MLAAFRRQQVTLLMGRSGQNLEHLLRIAICKKTNNGGAYHQENLLFELHQIFHFFVTEASIFHLRYLHFQSPNLLFFLREQIFLKVFFDNVKATTP